MKHLRKKCISKLYFHRSELQNISLHLFLKCIVILMRQNWNFRKYRGEKEIAFLVSSRK